MRIEQYSISGLGHLSAMVVDDEARVAVVVDPRRDVDLYLDRASDQGLRITAVLETHLHNDYVSGARDLAALTGATHHIGAGAELAYEHRGLRDGEPVEVAGLRFDTLDTPGHTPEHVAYTVADARAEVDAPAALFSGGSLLVGAVGRTDLLGQANAVPYAHAMYHSLHDRILPLGDAVHVHPTHGAGSLCSIGIGSMPSTTIGAERQHDPLLAPMDIDAFARALLAGQPAIPPYFARMRPMNQGGPALLDGRVPVPPTLDPAAFAAAIAAGAQVVDARDAASHVAGHIPGSISIPLDESFGTWLGWVVDLDRPVALVVAGLDDVEPLMRQAIRIGRDEVSGVLVGLDAWGAAGYPPRGERAHLDRRPRPRPRPRRPVGAPAPHRRPPVVRVRHGPRPGGLAHPRRLARRPPHRPAARPTDRDDVRRRLPGVDRGIAPALGRLRTGRVGRERVPGVGRRRLPGRARVERESRPRLTPQRAAPDRVGCRGRGTSVPVTSGPRADPWRGVADATMPA